MSDTDLPTRKRAPSKRFKATALTERDWVKAAMSILMHENVRGIRIDALCKKLGVTKGSFYWHFSSRAELLKSMLLAWRRRNTLDIIQNLSRETGDRRTRLERLLSLTRRPNAPEFSQIEQSIRDWGRRAPNAREAVEDVDQIRLQYFTQIFTDMGFTSEDARRRAYVAYAVMMGDSILWQTVDMEDGDAAMQVAIDLLVDSHSKTNAPT